MSKNKTLVVALAMLTGAGIGVVHAESSATAKSTQLPSWESYPQRLQWDSVQLGPRPFYLVEGMDEGVLKDRLLECKDGPFYRTDFSIGHRGAALQFPEHSDVAYMAGIRMGAGIVECDVTFTKDGVLVCRHSECDLATTTNIVATDLNAKCTVPWTGPVDGAHPAPQCCASDLTLGEFKSLKAKMDASNPAADTPEGFLGGTANWRTDLYVGRANVVTFRESIELNELNGVKHTPELKGATHQDRIEAIFGGQAQYAQKFIDELNAAGVDPTRAWVQSFNLDDILYWIKNEPEFGQQAVYLDSIDPTANPPIPRLTVAELRQLKQQGVQVFAPPMWALLDVNDAGEVIPSQYALDIKGAGLKIITWTFERSDLRNGASKGGWYYLFDPEGKAIRKDSDMYKALDVLARRVRIEGIFSDWPATVTYYANCMGL
ncbi:MAG TPA: glycerophosphodiester phosphodiesterase family protein [Candidatus Competibacteraceae bacterium]|nr:glycerophosphodiester phosphodiesterase family protein [Candidatus Competibacteraceae bacterium]